MRWQGFLFWGAVIGLAAWKIVRRGLRQRALQLACWRSGLRFSDVDMFVDSLWLPFPVFGTAWSPEITNVVWDRRDETVRVFDLEVASESQVLDEVTFVQRVTCGVATLVGSCPRITIASRGGTDLEGIPASGSEVTLELETFNRRFRVSADDPRAAIAFCDQRMMQTLLALPLDVTVHVREHVMLILAPILAPGQVLLLLQVAGRLRAAVPPVMASLYPPRPAEGPHEDRWLQGHWSPDPIGDHAPDPTS
jgi:hypothetical protein